MVDCKNIIIKNYALNLSFLELAEEFITSRSGVDNFNRAVEKCEGFVVSHGSMNYAIAELVYLHRLLLN